MDKEARDLEEIIIWFNALLKSSNNNEGMAQPIVMQYIHTALPHLNRQLESLRHEAIPPLKEDSSTEGLTSLHSNVVFDRFEQLKDEQAYMAFNESTNGENPHE